MFQPVPYDLGKWNFDTDYDRENPVTKAEAIEEFARVKLISSTIYFKSKKISNMKKS
jgi:hypothetical protein